MLESTLNVQAKSPHTVFVVGVGRSGTTFVYRILQGLFSQLYGRSYYSTYEPLIWQHQLFNRPYEECGPYFGKTASLAWDGIHAHLSTPMFIKTPGADRSALGFPVFRHLSSDGGPAQPHLAKLIRMNGRLPMLRGLNKSAKIVVVIRNPVDTLNSVKNLFSFYGDDFYPSDFPRFCDELGNQLILDQEQCSWAEKQCEYVYQMSRAAISFAQEDEMTCIVDYDRLSENSAGLIAELCTFLDADPVDSMHEAADRRLGPVSDNIKLSPSELDDALPYLRAYANALNSMHIPHDEFLNACRERYSGRAVAEDMDESLEGLTTNQLRNRLRRERAKSHKLEQQLQRPTES